MLARYRATLSLAKKALGNGNRGKGETNDAYSSARDICMDLGAPNTDCRLLRSRNRGPRPQLWMETDPQTTSDNAHRKPLPAGVPWHEADSYPNEDLLPDYALDLAE